MISRAVFYIYLQPSVSPCTLNMRLGGPQGWCEHPWEKKITPFEEWTTFSQLSSP